MNPWYKNQGVDKHATAEGSRGVNRVLTDPVIASRSSGAFDNEGYFKGIKGSSRREMMKDEKEVKETRVEGEFSKGTLMDSMNFEMHESPILVRETPGSLKLAAGESSIPSKSIEGPMLRRDSATNYFCWKSPYDDREICYPSNSQSLYFKRKKKQLKPPIYDELTCPVCRKLYSKAQLLPCNHSICEHCIPRQKTISNKGVKKHAIVTCPVCRENHYFASTEKVKFPENFLLNEILNRLEKRRKKSSKKKAAGRQPYCQLCESKNRQIAMKKCETCDLNFCRDCLKQHDKTYTDHNFRDPSGGEPLMKCFHHPDSNLSMFCLSDKIPICDECSKEKHKDHPTSTLQDAFKDQTIHLFHIIAKYGKVKDESENDMLRLSIFKSKLQESRTEFQKELSNGFKLLHDQLKQKEAQVKEIYENGLNLKIANINHYMEATAKEVLGLEGLIQYAKEAVKEMNQFVLLQTVSHLIEQLRMKVADINISGHKLITNSTEPYKLDFESILAQMNEIFSPVTKHFELFKDHKASPVDKKIETSVSIKKPTEIKETERISVLSEESNGNMTETQQESGASFESERSVDRKSSKTSQEETTNSDVVVPPTIYHHTVQGNTAKIFWMVPEYDLVDSFDVQLQEMGNNNGALPQLGVIFSGIDASSFETQVKANSEAIFKVRAISAFGQSDWSYPYKVSTKKS